MAEHRSLMTREATSWFEIVHMLDLLEARIENQECVILVEDQFVRPDVEEVYLFDGSVVRIWIGSYFDPDSPANESDTGLQVKETEFHVMEEGNTQGKTSESRTAASLPFAPASSGVQMMVLLALIWCGIRKQRCRKASFAFKVQGVRRKRRWRGLRLQNCHRKAGLFLCLLFSQSVLAEAHEHSPQRKTHRYGETLHPGPSCFLGTSNPVGIRGKEMVDGQLPFGIWGIAETHLALPGLRTVKNAFQRAGAEYHRKLSALPGAMVSLRSRSETAGTWAGVMTVADLILRPVHINWPHNEYLGGRAQITQCWMGPFLVMGAMIYGWPSCPTYPKALEDTNKMLETVVKMLETVVKELVISRTGPRYLMGDFNHAASKMPIVDLLKSYRWMEIQDLGFQRGIWEPMPTCRGATTIDFVFVSPEMIPFYWKTCSWPWFADHVILGAEFEFPVQPEPQQSWPQPPRIPWHEVPWDAWGAQQQEVLPVETVNMDEAYSLICHKYEESFNGYINTPDGLLPSGCKGRGQRSTPTRENNRCHCSVPPDQGKCANPRSCLVVPRKDGSSSFVDCKASCMDYVQGAKPPMPSCIVLNSGGPFSEERDFEVAFLTGGRSDQYIYKGAHWNSR